MSLHIYAPSHHFIGQVRYIGDHKWETVTGRCKTSESAMSKAALKMKGRHRARVLMITHNGYYEPNIVMECKR